MKRRRGYRLELRLKDLPFGEWIPPDTIYEIIQPRGRYQNFVKTLNCMATRGVLERRKVAHRCFVYAKKNAPEMQRQCLSCRHVFVPFDRRKNWLCVVCVNRISEGI